VSNPKSKRKPKAPVLESAAVEASSEVSKTPIAYEAAPFPPALLAPPPAFAVPVIQLFSVILDGFNKLSPGQKADHDLICIVMYDVGELMFGNGEISNLPKSIKDKCTYKKGFFPVLILEKGKIAYICHLNYENVN